MIKTSNKLTNKDNYLKYIVCHIKKMFSYKSPCDDVCPRIAVLISGDVPTLGPGDIAVLGLALFEPEKMFGLKVT